ncbi:MAG: NUDIX domain-containing protein [OM182 bacterium]|nr:MAG: NUDIX domain-containing protein [OM182 bacterium]HBK18518.1 NUDIX hydrolase [Gammaproteobacteria bacterium]
MHRSKLRSALMRYQENHPDEGETVSRFMALLKQDNCFRRDCWLGHVTGSAWLVDPKGERLLLTHHRKLKIWVQLGGHSDGDSDTPGVALREAEEESGLSVERLGEDILDIDIHSIPARGAEPAHEHFDVRYAMRAGCERFVVSEESLELAWVPIQELAAFTQEASLLRMREKWLQNRDALLK